MSVCQILTSALFLAVVALAMSLQVLRQVTLSIGMLLRVCCSWVLNVHQGSIPASLLTAGWFSCFIETNEVIEPSQARKLRTSSLQAVFSIPV